MWRQCMTAAQDPTRISHAQAARAIPFTHDLPLHLLDFNKTEVGFVDQRCGLKRVAATLVAQVTPRDSAQLIAHKRQQLVECRSLAAAPRQQQLSVPPRAV